MAEKVDEVIGVNGGQHDYETKLGKLVCIGAGEAGYNYRFDPRDNEVARALLMRALGHDDVSLPVHDQIMQRPGASVEKQ